MKDADAIGILDNRAATYCKLEQYDQARRDAKHMIKKGKEDERVSCRHSFPMTDLTISRVIYAVPRSYFWKESLKRPWKSTHTA